MRTNDLIENMIKEFEKYQAGHGGVLTESWTLKRRKKNYYVRVVIEEILEGEGTGKPEKGGL